MKLYRIKNSPVWYVSIGSGKQRIQKSTGKTDYNEARRVADEFASVAMIKDEAARVASVGAVVSRKLETASALESSRLLLSSLSPVMTDKAGRALKPSTMRLKSDMWRFFVRFAESRGVSTVGAVSSELGAAFLSSLGDRAQQVAYFVCRQVFTALNIPSPFGTSKPVRASAVTHREPLSADEEKRLLDTVDSMTAKSSQPESREYPALLRLLLLTGLRLGDAVTLRWDMVDIENMTISRVMAKTSRPVVFPLHPSLLPWLVRRDETYVFPALAMSYIHARGCASHRIRDYFKRAGIIGDKQQYCAHCLRTTFASKCAVAGVPLAVIQSWLGHTSQEVTRIYARIEDINAKRAALARLPGL